MSRTQAFSQLAFQYEKELGDNYMEFVRLVEKHKYWKARILLLKSVLHYKSKKNTEGSPNDDTN